MKKFTDYYSREKVAAVKGMARVLIEYEIKTRGITDSLTEDDTNVIGYQCCRFFDCMNCDFRMLIDEWIFTEAEKMYNKMNNQ